MVTIIMCNYIYLLVNPSTGRGRLNVRMWCEGLNEHLVSLFSYDVESARIIKGKRLEVLVEQEDFLRELGTHTKYVPGGEYTSHIKISSSVLGSDEDIPIVYARFEKLITGDGKNAA
ncbi:MAG: hypothetical protein ACOCXG_01845 [Nanoarchaeota archaeon]